jgi:N-acyl-L-homoserine lactone synthetase
MNLKEEFPNIIGAIDEEIDELRYLIVVDENYGDDDSDEFDVFDPEDYNYLVYITPRVQNILGEERLNEAVRKLQCDEKFKDFFANEDDMYGIQCDLEEEEIAKVILKTMDELL